MTTPISSMALVLVASIFGSFGAVFLKMGAEKLKTGGVLGIFSWQAALGVGLFLLSSVFFVLGIKHGELSVLYPMVSLGYVWTLLWSRLFFKEPVTKQKFLALGMILTGIVFIAALG
jgi:multidrug transporter EmrE-like cation transporter